MKCISGIDWLSFSAYFDKGVEMQPKTPVFFAHKKSYGTRNFSEIWEVFYNRRVEGVYEKKLSKFCSVCCRPQSSILNDRLLTFKLENDILYTDEWGVMLMLFIEDFKLTNVRVQRIDLFRDFQQFSYKGKMQSPYRFLQDIACGRWKKKGGSKFSLFADEREGGIYAATYGSILSGRQLCIYNKSKELREVHDKPYIRIAWKNAGFNQSEPVYRAEVRICKKGLEMLDLECNEYTRFDLRHVYDYSLLPLMDAWFAKVAVWTDLNGREFKPFILSQTDETEYPYVPKFLKKAPIPDKKAQAKNVLSWAKAAHKDVADNNYGSAFHCRAQEILRDFCELLERAIPPDDDRQPKFYDATMLDNWIIQKAGEVSSIARKTPYAFLPSDLFDFPDISPDGDLVTQAKEKEHG